MRCSLLLALITLSAAVLASCAGGGKLLGAGGPGQFTGEVPPLAELKDASVINDHSQTGFQAVEQSANFGGSQMNATLGEIVWAIFAFAPGSEPLVEAEVAITAGILATQAFVGVSNFDTQTWEYAAPLELAPAGGQFPVPLDSAKHVSPGGNVYLLLVAPLGSEFFLDLVTFRTLGNDAPLADIQADVVLGDAPLAVSFDASGSTDLDGAIALYEWDTQGDGDFEAETGTTPAHTFNYTGGGVFEATVRVTDDDGATDTASITITVTVNGNIPPTGVIETDVTEGDPTFTANFDASASLDPDGTIVLYEWDGDGDGTFEGNTGATPEYSFQYDEPGTYNARVRATDDQGLADLATSEEILSHGWVVVPLADTTMVLEPHLALVSPGPALVCINDNFDLEVFAARTKYGDRARDWDSVVIDDAPDHAGTIAAVDGRLSLCYSVSAGEPGLVYARNSAGKFSDIVNWDFVTVHDGQASPGQLMVVAGNPAIAYGDVPATAVRFARSSTANGLDPADWQSVIVDDDESGQTHSVALIGGNPAIAYRMFFGGGSPHDELRYARSATPDGGASGDWQVVTLAPTVINPELSLAEVDGKPALVFSSSDLLKFLHSESATGGDPLDWQALSLFDDSGSSIGRPAPLALHAGKPVVLFAAQSETLLQLAESSTPGGTVRPDWSIADIPTGGTPQKTFSFWMAEIHGKTAICFRDEAKDQLKYAIRL